MFPSMPCRLFTSCDWWHGSTTRRRTSPARAGLVRGACRTLDSVPVVSVVADVTRLVGIVIDHGTCFHHPTPHHHRDRKSTRLNSSHHSISYAVFCLKKKKNRY